MTVTNVESGTVRKISRLPGNPSLPLALTRADALPLCLRNKTVKEDDLPPPSEKEEERMDDFNRKPIPHRLSNYFRKDSNKIAIYYSGEQRYLCMPRKHRSLQHGDHRKRCQRKVIGI